VIPKPDVPLNGDVFGGNDGEGGSCWTVESKNVLALVDGSPVFKRMFSSPWFGYYQRDADGFLRVPVKDVDWRCFENVVR
jgi:hypothetical protein